MGLVDTYTITFTDGTTTTFDVTNGDVGAAGPQGPKGDTGEGVPSGGTAGQVLTKVSGTDFDTQWSTPQSGNSIKSVTVTLDTAITPYPNTEGYYGAYTVTSAQLSDIITAITNATKIIGFSIIRYIANNSYIDTHFCPVPITKNSGDFPSGRYYYTRLESDIDGGPNTGAITIDNVTSWRTMFNFQNSPSNTLAIVFYFNRTVSALMYPPVKPSITLYYEE